MSSEEKIESKVMKSIEEIGFNNSIVFLVKSQEAGDKMKVDAIAACSGDLSILQDCLTMLLEKDEKIYDFVAESLDGARKLRNKKNPNIN